MRISRVLKSVLAVALFGALLAATPGVSGPAGAAPSQFDDVPEGAYFADAVAWLADSEITTGTSATTFSPGENVTRGQMAAFIERYAQVEGNPGEHGFGDVPGGSYYDGAVSFLVENGITTGTSDTTYSPGAFVTRAQMATFLYRFSGEPPSSAPMPFVDVPSGTWFYEPVRWLAAEEITTGTSETTYSPDALVSRAQMATFLWRLAGEPTVGEFGLNRFDPAATQVLDEDDAEFTTLDVDGTSEFEWTGGEAPLIGQVLAFGVSDETPEGFIGRVVGVSGDTVTTQPAVLNDAIPSADFTISKDLTEAESEAGQLSLQAAIQKGLDAEPLTCTAGGAVAIDVSLDIVPSMVLDASWGFGGPKFEAGLELEVTPTLEGSISGKVECSTQLSVDGPKLKPISFVVGGFPVVIQPEISFEIELYANFAASANPYISYTETVGIIIEYDDDWGVRYPTGDTDGFSMGVDYTGDAVLGVEVRARLDLKAYGTVGIYLTLGPFIETTVQLADPWWSIDVGLRAGAGITVNLFDFWEDSHHFGSIDLLRYNLARAASNDDPPDGFVDVSTLKVTALAAGDAHTCAITAADEIACWGRSTAFQVGNDSALDRPEAVFLNTVSDELPIDIAAGASHTCAVFADGTVECWGDNDHGQAGQVDPADVRTPARVNGISGARRVVAGSEHTCVLTIDFDVWCWGAGENGQTGLGHFDDISTPTRVGELDAVVDLDAASSHTCVALADGTAWCWGNNGYGEVEWQRTESRFSTPVQMTAFSGADEITQVAVGFGRTCAVYGEFGEMSCWGYNNRGQIGIGSTSPTTVTFPTAVPTQGVVLDVSLGTYHSCAIINRHNLNDAPTYCWGYNLRDQLGHTPVSITVPTIGSVDDDDLAVSVHAGGSHTCQVTETGRAQCWGSDNDGQLGNDSTKADRASPAYVRDPINAL